MSRHSAMPEFQVEVSDIPKDTNIDFRNSTYLKSWETLPTPTKVRVAARQKAVISTEPNWAAPPVLFRAERLWVKWGKRVQFSEGQSLYMVDRYLAGVFPAPEIHEWRTDNAETFLDCRWLEGQTVEDAWDVMKAEDKVTFSHELRQAFETLRRLRQHPQQFVGESVDVSSYRSSDLDTLTLCSTPFTKCLQPGAVDRSTIYDRILSDLTFHAGPFQSVKDFYDPFSRSSRARLPGGAKDVPTEPYRHQLADNRPIKFTMSDLHPRNIIVTSTPSEPCSLVGVVDLEQSAWLPEYWKDLKARVTVDSWGEIGRKYIWVPHCHGLHRMWTTDGSST